MKAQPSSANPKYSHSYTLKPTIIPPNMILVEDTREQSPLFHPLPKGLVIVRDTLANGDYSIRGFENQFAIERKNIGDLFPYCSSEREKTVAKMQRFRDMIKAGGFVGLVIEERECDVYQHQLFTKVHPEVIRGAILSFIVRYGVFVYFSGDRANSRRTVLDLAAKFYNIQHEV